MLDFKIHVIILLHCILVGLWSTSIVCEHMKTDTVWVFSICANVCRLCIYVCIWYVHVYNYCLWIIVCLINVDSWKISPWAKRDPNKKKEEREEENNISFKIKVNIILSLALFHFSTYWLYELSISQMQLFYALLVKASISCENMQNCFWCSSVKFACNLIVLLYIVTVQSPHLTSFSTFRNNHYSNICQRSTALHRVRLFL